MRALIKVILFLVLVGLALAGGTLVGQLIKNDPGYILIAYETTTIEMSLWVGLALALVIAVVGYISLRVLSRVLDSPVGLGRLWSRLRGRSARGATQKGFMELRMGRYEAALKHLTSAAPRSDIAFVNYLSAAEAANALGYDDQRDELLVKALEEVPGSELAIGLAEARMQFEKGEYEGCADTLTALRKIKPKDRELITMSCQVFEQLDRTDDLIELLPLARKLGAIDAEQADALEVEAHRRALEQAIGDAEPVEGEMPLAIKNTWDSIPKRLRHHASLQATLFNGLVQSGAPYVALAELEKTLKKTPEDELFDLYSTLPEVDLARRMAFLTKLSKSFRDAAVLERARGRIAMAQGDLTAAESALEASLADDPCAETYEALAQVYRAQNRPDMELKALQGLNEAVRDWPSTATLPVVVAPTETTQ